MMIAAALTAFCGVLASSTTRLPVAHTSLGDVQGAAHGDVAVFRGLRYTPPPARFAPATVLDQPWAGVLNASSFGAPCLQSGNGDPNEFPDPEAPKPSEDCLFLNVWSPSVPESPSAAKPSDLLPVMFWIHGGGMSIGTGSEKWFDGTRLAAEQQVVVITVNYRLGPLGFLVSPELKQLYGEG